ncbi:hypothetical protein PoB_001999100 [Plakobranchus ocellatus]|uniref:Uncharacterized protein n=1 Tax=Plakobranchus ocellatus TaxID=259542 RepID=A0AAV3Z2F8_9GAST|nr:hypothetical protein PoB_001999100 [Plakobranchus ocellatus]
MSTEHRVTHHSRTTLLGKIYITMSPIKVMRVYFISCIEDNASLMLKDRKVGRGWRQRNVQKQFVAELVELTNPTRLLYIRLGFSQPVSARLISSQHFRIQWPK